jgi:starch phosphorylase
VKLREDVLTIGFARRATPYKRADLLLRDMDRLHSIARRVGPIQVIYGGKAHPYDQPGKDMIRNIYQRASQIEDGVRIAYLENYNMALAKLIVSGADLWLNTPRRPQEASGTSGMKAACNGVPSLSVLDGWWIEGHIEGVTGWSIPHGHTVLDDEGSEVGALYEKLERVILPLYYGAAPGYTGVMRSSIALNASFFNTQRVVSQYLRNAYAHPDGAEIDAWALAL